jgi:hypothetical protein
VPGAAPESFSEILGFTPPELAIGEVAVTVRTPLAAPFEAAVIIPLASTVIFAFV